MDYVAGITLRQYLEQQPGGRISFADALTLLTPVMDALRAVHKEGLLHRDLAPDNIYLTQDGRIKLLDFGAARFAASEHSKASRSSSSPATPQKSNIAPRATKAPGPTSTAWRPLATAPLLARSRRKHWTVSTTTTWCRPPALGIAITPGQEATLLRAGRQGRAALSRYGGIARGLARQWCRRATTGYRPKRPRFRPGVEDTPTAKPPAWANTTLLLALISLLLIIATVALIRFPWPGTTASPTNQGR